MQFSIDKVGRARGHYSLVNTVRGDIIHSDTIIQSNAPGSKLMNLFTPLNTDIKPTVCGTKNYDKINKPM